VSEHDVRRALMGVNTRKAAGPDGIQDSRFKIQDDFINPEGN